LLSKLVKVSFSKKINKNQLPKEGSFEWMEIFTKNCEEIKIADTPIVNIATKSLELFVSKLESFKEETDETKKIEYTKWLNDSKDEVYNWCGINPDGIIIFLQNDKKTCWSVVEFNTNGNINIFCVKDNLIETTLKKIVNCLVTLFKECAIWTYNEEISF